MKKVLARMALPLALVTLMSMVWAEQAQSQPACEPGTLCVYTSNVFSGDVQIVTPQGGCIGLNQPVGSVINATSTLATFHDDPSCSGAIARIGPGESLSFSSFDASANFGFVMFEQV
ncbi:MAG: peptidase inhibitor family I36 protein [Egibacteraceae bacterium]